jgi:Mg-chelatase subunit ChlD
VSLLDSGSCKLLIIPDEPALRGGRVAVSRGSLAARTAALRVAGRRGVMTVGVRAVPHDEVPPGVILVPETLADRLGLRADTSWQLATAVAAPLASLTIEAMVEEPADDVLKGVREDAGLVGQCLWAGQDVGSNVLEIGSRQFRVRTIDQAGRQDLREVVPSTQVELFIPAARVGLDVVILADCSGSMEVDDLPVSAERLGWGGSTYRTRLDALKEALLQMIAARLRTAGRESRMALLRFSDQAHQRFPVGDGMLPVDATSPRELITDFEQAVRSLDVGGGTDIAGALLRAAELLDRQGKPGNDRLIVLVSDGRPWVAKSADATGEVVFAVDDPVSLMTHLHKRRNMRVHAIGISNDALYDAWLRRTRHNDGVGLRPDHPLLARLVEVGGGDPTRIGGIDVLEGYFSGLGAGLTRHVGTPAQAAGARRLGQGTISLLRQGATADVAQRCRSAARRLHKSMLEVNEYARRLAGRQLDSWIPFDKTDKIDLMFSRDELLIPIGSQYHFENVLMRLHNVIVEQGPGRRKSEKATRPEVLQDIYECFGPYVDRLNPIRQVYCHDKSSGSGRDQRDLEACVKAFVHYLRVIDLDCDDAAGWSQLRLLLLEDAADCTQRALEAARRAARRLGSADVAPPPTADKPGRPKDESPFVVDLRVRN